MRRIESHIDTNAADYKANFAAMSERLKEFHARQHAARFERPQRDIDRLARQNKLGVRCSIRARRFLNSRRWPPAANMMAPCPVPPW